MLVRAKLLLMGCLLLVSVLLATLGGRPWHFIVCAALCCSWVGDAMLARYAPVARGVKDPFLAGMGAFALAHGLYILAFALSLSGMPRLHVANPGWALGRDLVGALLPVYWLAGLFFWMWVVLRSEKPALLKGVTLVYAEVLLSMAAVACAAAFTGVMIAWPLMLGGTLFVISDGIIALRMFGGRFTEEKRYEVAVWGTYFPAQVLLLAGALWLR